MKTSSVFLFKLICIFIPTFLFAQIKTSTITVGNNSEMDITVTVNDNTGDVFFEISGPSTKWFGAGFNTTNMSGAAYTIVSNNSGGNPVEYNMNGQVAPTLQSTQNLTNITSSTSGTTKTFEFDRVTNTSNTDDYTFSTITTSLDIAWAVGSGSSLAYHSTNKGTSTMTFTDPCTTAVALDTLSNINICQGDSSLIFNSYQSSPGWYSDTLLNDLGCDSIISSIQAITDSTLYNTLDTVYVCIGDSTEIFGNTVSSSETYTDTLQDINGCDSIANTYLHVTEINTDVIVNNNSFLVMGISEPYYYWLDCNTNTIIDSTTAPFFNTSTGGSYALILTYNGCVDTSSCYTFEDIGIDEFSNHSNLILSQEKGELNIELTQNYESIRIILTNIHGQRTYNGSFNNQKLITISTADLTNGIYFAKIILDKEIVERKLILY